jgi:type I restriction enzyme S subunit
MPIWEAKPLGEVCTIKPPKAEARAKLADVDEVSFAPMEDLGIGVKYLQPVRTRRLAEVSGSYTYFADGDVLLAKITPCFENGKLGVARGLTNGVGFGSSEYIVLRPTSTLDAEFLYYYLARPTFLEEGARTMTGAVGHKRVTKEFVESYQIPLPPVTEQRRIVAILDEAFEGIGTAKANAEKNLQNARELGQLLRDCLFSRIASHAERRSLGEICAFVRGPFGGSLKKEIFVEDGYAVYEQSHAIYDQFSEIRYFVDEAKFSEMRRFELRPNDLIMSCSGTMGRVAIAPDDLRRGIINQALLKLTPAGSVDSWYLKYWMESRDFQDALGQCSGGAAIQNVASVSVLKEIALPLPALAAQRAAVVEIDRFAAETERLRENHQQKLVALDELKKSLLHQAFSGAL